MEEKIKMAPPWIQYVNALTALFREDKDIKVEYDNDTYKVKLLVDNKPKAEALAQLLPETVAFGNIDLSVIVVPSNSEVTKRDLFKQAFAGNSAVEMFYNIDNVFSNPLTYIVFKKKVVQYYNDDLSDIHGNRSTLYQNLAEDVFDEHDGIMFCTDTGGEKIGKPLGEWP